MICYLYSSRDQVYRFEQKHTYTHGLWPIVPDHVSAASRSTNLYFKQKWDTFLCWPECVTSDTFVPSVSRGKWAWTILSCHIRRRIRNFFLSLAYWEVDIIVVIITVRICVRLAHVCALVAHEHRTLTMSVSLLHETFSFFFLRRRFLTALDLCYRSRTIDWYMGNDRTNASGKVWLLALETSCLFLTMRREEKGARPGEKKKSTRVPVDALSCDDEICSIKHT